MKRLANIATSLLLICCTQVFAITDTYVPFDDSLLEESLVHPDWFDLSSGSLTDDLQDAVKDGKKGLIVYFGQKRCPYCEKFLNVNLAASDISHYIQQYYKVIPIDVWGIQEVTDTDGIKYTEQDLSSHYKTTFTPALVFYDIKGKPVFRLRGYYPPYRFRAALKYVAEEFYKQETFREYLERAEPGLFFLQGGLTERDFFSEPPYILNHPKKPILAVFFEQGNCHTCDLLHSGPLIKGEILNELKKMDVVQLDMWSDTKVITPQGKDTTAIQWADDLGLYYAPTIIFFDETGNEIIRIDSVVEFYRLLGVLEYLNHQGFLTEPNHQEWALKRRKTN